MSEELKKKVEDILNKHGLFFGTTHYIGMVEDKVSVLAELSTLINRERAEAVRGIISRLRDAFPKSLILFDKKFEEVVEEYLSNKEDK